MAEEGLAQGGGDPGVHQGRAGAEEQALGRIEGGRGGRGPARHAAYNREMPERRKATRYPRRLQVRYWALGEPEPFTGYSANISATGMFVGTASPLPPGTRVRVEILDPERGFVVEGIVAHAAKISPILQKIRTSGMGVRFLRVEELVKALMDPGRAGSTAFEPAHGVSAPAVEPARVPPEAAAAGTAGGGAAGTAVAESPPPASRPAAAPPEVFTVRYATREQFQRAFDRDIRKGGLFLSTGAPAALDREVLVEIFPPHGGDPVRLAARVVQRFEPGSRAAGMGVAFLDPAAALARLAPLAGDPPPDPTAAGEGR